MPNAKQNLVIVESPSKAKTIGKYLGPDYQVKASMGHLRDLAKSTLSVDIEHDFEPEYYPLKGKEEIISELQKAAKHADRVYLATDPDREGEAISWHLKYLLSIPDDATYRVTFNEITKRVVTESIASPREIDQDLVDAQQARRILDRVVGYSISPLLWKKVKRGLSAGRVQSACLAMVCEREDEINAFVPEEYWSLDASVQVDKAKKPLLIHYQDKNRTLTCEEDVNQLMKQLEHETFAVKEIKKSERTRKAPLPFTTSTLQQEAARQLNFSPQKTMRIAQQLYEGVDIKGSGTVGIITYLRTDSTRIAEEADQAAREYIGATYGEEYLSVNPTAKQKGKIQDAHEAIRPTDITRTPSAVKESLSRDQLRLYQLVWKRFAASRMADAKNETTTAKIMAGNACFTASTSRQLFDGFLMLYDNNEEKPEKNAAVDKLTEESVITLQEFHPDQHFTQPPAHFTEASLVKTMEECGIGRPSTYAPTIAILLGRHYVIKEEKNLYVTELGEAVNDIMKHSFPQIVDESFTARMEARLDQVAEGQWRRQSRS